MTAHLRPFDLAIVAAYLIAITLFGLRFREKKSAPGTPQPSRSLQSYFLANNTIPWWAIALSIVSAETSTLTIISIPGVAFAGDFGFLQIVIGYMVGRIVVAAIFLPRYFQGSMLTAYQLIDRRFGPVLHKVTAGLFLLTRAAAEGVRVFAVSIVVGLAIGTRDTLSIAIISALTLLYTFEGGMAAVIWTDVVQMAIYIGGTFVAIWSLGQHIGADRSAIAGWSTILPIASAAGKFHMFNFALNLTTTYTFWAGLLGGTFLTMASHGTDQLMVQRLLAARSLRESRLALLSSGVVIFMQFALFLLIGAGLYVFYGQHPGTSFRSNDYIFPTFIVRELPLGLAGLLVAAILAAAMSNLSAALNSLSSTTVVDFYLRLRPLAPDRERNLIAKSSTVLWAIVLFAIAIYSLRVGGKGHVVEIGLSIASVAYGCLLGVFLLGTLTKFATEIGASIGMLCGFALNLYLWQGSFPKVIWQQKIPRSHCTFLPGAIEPTSCPLAHTITIPHIAFTWYVIIGAIVTFAIGSLFSLIFRKQSNRTITATTTASLLLLFLLSFPQGTCFTASAQSSAARTPGYPEASASGLIAKLEKGALAPGFAFASQATKPTTPDFTHITTLITDAIAAHKLPGAVVLIGHNNHIAFEQAYGDRKLANEPGLDGKPSPAEPMTEDTIFDMASLTKDLATATSIMQLYEAGKITSFDDPVEKYLPAFNEQHDPARARVTLRMLLTHTSGEAPDISLADPWGLAAPDRAEGIHRALTTALRAAPGSVFTYSDINFILLGHLVETLSGQREDVYARQHIFLPLGMMNTAYHSIDHVCGSHVVYGSAIEWRSDTTPTRGGGVSIADWICPSPSTWPTYMIKNSAPTAHDNEGTAATNPDFDHLLRGTVHDPTARRMGGVAGHAGVFSTAHDMSLYAGALLEKLLHNTGPFPLKQSTLQLMSSPEQPGRTPDDLARANAADAAAIAAGDKPSEPGLAPHYPAIPGRNLRGFGWDIDTAFSKPRGLIFPIGSFGHTGYTGTSLWMDPASDTYVILLSNAVHPRDQHRPISNLRGQVATAAARALGLTQIAYQPKDCDGKPDGPSVTVEQAAATDLYCRTSGATDCPGVLVCASAAPELKMTEPVGAPPSTASSSRVGIGAADLRRTSTRPHLLRASTSRYPEASASGLISTPDKEGLQPLRYAFARTGSTAPSSPEEAARAAAARAELKKDYAKMPEDQVYCCGLSNDPDRTLTGIDVLESSDTLLKLAAAHKSLPKKCFGKKCFYTLHFGLLTNQSGVDKNGVRTIDYLNSVNLHEDNLELTTVFTPEHGLYGKQDTDSMKAETNPYAPSIPLISLYGPHPADRRPTHAQLANLDAVLIDLQDAGVRFWTYEAAVGYFLEAASREESDFHHLMEIVILDRPNPVGGLAVQGPVSDPGRESYVNYMPLPVRHGLTLGELARYIVATKQAPLTTEQMNCLEPCPYHPPRLATRLTVIPMQHWFRSEFYAQTGLPWVNPSPNLRSPEAALLYPALGLIETTNISVGRGTSHPFSFFGAGTAPTKPSTSTATGGLTDTTSSTTPGGPANTSAKIGNPANAPANIGYPDHAPAKIGYPEASASGLISSEKSKGGLTPWFHATEVAAYLTARHIPGVAFTPTSETIAEDANHYPYHGQTIQAVRVTLTDPTLADTPELGIEILSALHHLYPTEFNLPRAMTLVCNQSTMDAITRGGDPRSIAATWTAPLNAFRAATAPFLLYK
jgi:SSS family transporter